MMKYEFEQIAGYEVSIDDYNNIIEPMYMASSLSKEEFVKTLNKKRFALKPLSGLIKDMKKLAKELKESCTHYTDYEKKEKLDSIITEYIQRKYVCMQSVTFIINEKELWSCYYPKSVEIYSTKSYKTYETIELCA